MLRAIPLARDGTNGSIKSARTRRSYVQKELGGGGLTMANSAGALKASGAKGKKTERRVGRRPGA